MLAVDDDPAYTRYLSHVLTRNGYDVETAPDGMTAVSRVSFEPPVDLVLLDLNMPSLDGIQTAEAIRTALGTSAPYSILLTADNGIDTRIRALDSGIDEFLTKQAAESEILARIRSAARRLYEIRRLSHEKSQLQVLALTDELTGLLNRRGIVRTAEELTASGRQFAAVMFDLDRFKIINDTWGHLAGDRILADVASSMKARVRRVDFTGRLGGDEFVVVLPGASMQHARAIAARLTESIRSLEWRIGDRTVSIDAQHGIALAPGDGKTFEQLLAVCDQNLYERKRAASTAGAQPQPRASIQ